ncbi:MAG: hypothetical protein WBQ73_00275 [Candidatus Babeliales bacterium]
MRTIKKPLTSLRGVTRWKPYPSVGRRSLVNRPYPLGSISNTTNNTTNTEGGWGYASLGGLGLGLLGVGSALALSESEDPGDITSEREQQAQYEQERWNEHVVAKLASRKVFSDIIDLSVQSILSKDLVRGATYPEWFSLMKTLSDNKDIAVLFEPDKYSSEEVIRAAVNLLRENIVVAGLSIASVRENNKQTLYGVLRLWNKLNEERKKSERYDWTFLNKEMNNYENAGNVGVRGILQELENRRGRLIAPLKVDKFKEALMQDLMRGYRLDKQEGPLDLIADASIEDNKDADSMFIAKSKDVNYRLAVANKLLERILDKSEGKDEVLALRSSNDSENTDFSNSTAVFHTIVDIVDFLSKTAKNRRFNESQRYWDEVGIMLKNAGYQGKTGERMDYYNEIYYGDFPLEFRKALEKAKADVVNDAI